MLQDKLAVQESRRQQQQASVAGGDGSFNLLTPLLPQADGAVRPGQKLIVTAQTQLVLQSLQKVVCQPADTRSVLRGIMSIRNEQSDRAFPDAFDGRVDLTGNFADDTGRVFFDFLFGEVIAKECAGAFCEG